jgi:TPR repeat protein
MRLPLVLPGSAMHPNAPGCCETHSYLIRGFADNVRQYPLPAGGIDADPHFTFAFSLAKGRGVGPDLSLVAQYYKLAADQNHSPAQFNYGCCCEHGLGVPIDLSLAAHYDQLAADQNHIEAQFNYAFCLAKGLGVPTYLSGAARYYI